MSVVFSVFDRVSGLFGNLNTSPNIATAFRNIKLSFSRDPMLEASKDDYSLAILAQFNERTGEFAVLKKPDIYSVSKILSDEIESPATDLLFDFFDKNGDDHNA